MRVFYLFTMFIFFCLTSRAQETRISMSVHPQLVWLVSDNEKVDNNGVMPGINSILEFDFYFAKKYAFYTGVSIDNIGGRLIFSDTIIFNVSGEEKSIPANTELKYRLQYLGIPLGLKLKTQEIGYTSFFLNMGFTPMINIRSKIYHQEIFPDKANAKDETDLFNVNYFLSAGVEYSLGGTTSLIGGIGYTSGFMDVTTKPDDQITTRSLFIKAGILF